MDQPSTSLRGDPLRHALGIRMQPGTEHERPAVLHNGQLLRRDVADRRAQPARVFEPDAGQDLDLGRDHVGGVVASPQTGLDHRHLDSGLGQL